MQTTNGLPNDKNLNDPTPVLVPRRQFLKGTGAALVAGGLAQTLGVNAAERQRSYKAAVIGWTGRGDYGHGYDVIFQGIPNVSLEAIADPNPEGLKKAAARTGAKRSYADYRQMLEKEKPDLVSIAARHPDVHKERALAAIEAGAHIFMEKPMTESAADADEIMKAAEKKGVKVAIAHVRRFTEDFVKIKRLLDEGFVGNVLDVRIQGKQDARVGGEDMIVLGTHDFDIMRMYFGDPLWCFASVTRDGRRIQKEDIRKGNEPILVAGDTIRAAYAFPKNIQVNWNSVKASDWNQRPEQRWAFEIHGTKRIIAHQAGFGMAYLDSAFFGHKDDKAKWKDLPNPQQWPLAPRERNPIANLIYAIETGGQPLCSGYDGRWAVEMVAAIYQSEFSGARVSFPLKQRTNPLVS